MTGVCKRGMNFYALYRVLWVWMILTEYDARASLSCACDSVGSIQRDVSPDASLQPLGATYMFSNVPAVQRVTESLYGNMSGTFTCHCTQQASIPSIRYLLAGSAPAGCLDAASVQSMCDQLSLIGLMECSNTWSSGAAGKASVPGVDTGALLEVANHAYRRSVGSGPCYDKVTFRGLPDAIIPSDPSLPAT
jgi:uncharacterized protein (UPF0261 family)